MTDNTRMCTGCGRQIPADYNVCPHCGRPQNVPQYGGAQQPVYQQPPDQSEPLGGGLTIILYLVSFFIWPIGLIIGLIWGGAGSDKERKHVGKNCLILGILGLVISCIVNIVLWWGGWWSAL
jgi:hypothetical protein